MTDEQMIEQIARAMALSDWPGNEWNGRCFSEQEQNEYRARARAAHSVMAGNVAELEELIDELVERGLGCGAFDDEPDPLWAKAAKATGRDPDTGNRAALAPYPERRHD